MNTDLLKLKTFRSN